MSTKDTYFTLWWNKASQLYDKTKQWVAQNILEKLKFPNILYTLDDTVVYFLEFIEYMFKKHTLLSNCFLIANFITLFIYPFGPAPFFKVCSDYVTVTSLITFGLHVSYDNYVPDEVKKDLEKGLKNILNIILMKRENKEKEC